ncbi:hypothetical protein MKK55_07510 [Methylobacterium sp. J-059]|uniref:hypothetical protein n=1 Tax=Methylobacterium sp. J-059 TaxID=2836643 RepID=UPI001FB924AD|nr:hypothetical protein [Methylobacterium sp. J-059]MCJ2038802.1 hypothetical protein [Methylobacterium sp. J-059]
MDARDNVETLLVLQPIMVDTGSPDREGRLVLADGLLIAVLVRLDTPEHEVGPGWFVEAAFGRLFGVSAPIFATLEEATRWLRQCRKA